MAKRELIDSCAERSTHCKDCTVRSSTLLGRVDQANIGKSIRWRHHLIKIKAKSNLYLNGSRPEYAYSIKKGWVMLYRNTSKGKRQILRFALPGDLLGLKTNDKGIISHSPHPLVMRLFAVLNIQRLRKLLLKKNLFLASFFPWKQRNWSFTTSI